jgi:hypothetical protein
MASKLRITAQVLNGATGEMREVVGPHEPPQRHSNSLQQWRKYDMSYLKLVLMDADGEVEVSDLVQNGRMVAIGLAQNLIAECEEAEDEDGE